MDLYTTDIQGTNRDESQEKEKETTKNKTYRPSYRKMVLEAIGHLNEKKGSSKHAIEQYLRATYNYGNTLRNNEHLKRTLRKMLMDSEIVHAKGQRSTGASGRFRLPSKRERLNLPKKTTLATRHRNRMHRPKKSAKKSNTRKTTLATGAKSRKKQQPNLKPAQSSVPPAEHSSAVGSLIPPNAPIVSSIAPPTFTTIDVFDPSFNTIGLPTTTTIAPHTGTITVFDPSNTIISPPSSTDFAPPTTTNVDGFTPSAIAPPSDLTLKLASYLGITYGSKMPTDAGDHL